MLLFCAGKLPPTKPIQMAEERVKAGGELWPAGSEDYLVREEPERWGRAWNVLLPILFLGVSAVSFRSFGSGRVMLDSACALSATVAFQFFLYGFQELLSPEEFLDHLCSGIAGSSLPVLLYLLTICFASLLDQLGLGTFLEQWASAWSVSWSAASPLFPAGLFLFAVLLTVLAVLALAACICYVIVIRPAEVYRKAIGDMNAGKYAEAASDTFSTETPRYAFPET